MIEGRRTRSPRGARLAATAAALSLSLLAPGRAGAVRVHVQGSARLEATATPDAAGFVLTGELRDDAGQPIEGARVSVIAVLSGAPDVPLPLPPPAPCAERARRAPPHAAFDKYELDTDARGAFCVRGTAPLLRGELVLRFAGSSSLAAAEARLAVAAEPGGITLRFEPPPEALELDRGALHVTAAARRLRRGGAVSPLEGLEITLEDERGKGLATGTTGGDGRARLGFEAGALAPPGPGELRLHARASEGLGAVSHVVPVVRRATVELVPPASPPAGDATDGVRLEIAARSAAGEVGEGSVEALVLGRVVSLAPVRAGHASLVVVVEAAREARFPVTLRYLPSTPYWLAGAPITVHVVTRGPRPLRALLWLLLVAAAATLVVQGWRRAPRRAPARSSAERPFAGRPKIELVAPAPAGARGWRGFVRDAHDGFPLAGAVLRVVDERAAGAAKLAPAARTDDAGWFELETSVDARARLVVEAPWHARLERPLPPPGEIAITLVTRRRALLDALVGWSRGAGPPFGEVTEPTPGELGAMARRLRENEVEAWASAVEAAAYGPEPVGAERDEAVRRLLPAGGPSGARERPAR